MTDECANRYIQNMYLYFLHANSMSFKLSKIFYSSFDDLDGQNDQLTRKICIDYIGQFILNFNQLFIQ